MRLFGPTQSDHDEIQPREHWIADAPLGLGSAVLADEVTMLSCACRRFSGRIDAMQLHQKGSFLGGSGAAKDSAGGGVARRTLCGGGPTHG
eukprot:4522122-Pleurochrysis_carterae.AAC.1